MNINLRGTTMETITKIFKVYTFDELSDEAKEKALIDQIRFEMDIMDETSPYWHCVIEMEKMRTPWFLGQAIYDDHKEDLIQTIKLSNWCFLEDGEYFPHERSTKDE